MTHPALLNDYQSMQPLPPTDLCITGITFDSALLGFTQPPGPPICTYSVKINSSGMYNPIVRILGCGAELKNLQPATTYTVAVCSQFGGRTSTASEERTFRTLGDSGAMIGDSRRNKQLEDQVVELQNQIDQLQVQMQRLQTDNHQWRTLLRKFLEESP